MSEVEKKAGGDGGEPVEDVEGTKSKKETEVEKNETTCSTGGGDGDGDGDGKGGTKAGTKSSKEQVEPDSAIASTSTSDGTDTSNGVDASSGTAKANSNLKSSASKSNTATKTGQGQEKEKDKDRESSVTKDGTKAPVEEAGGVGADADTDTDAGTSSGTTDKESKSAASSKDKKENDAADQAKVKKKKASNLATVPETVPSIPPPPTTVQKLKRAHTTGQFISNRTSTSSSTSSSSAGDTKNNNNNNNNISSNSQKSAFLSRSHSDRGFYHHQQFQQGQGIDAHPYARGSVIEVLYGVAPRKLRSRSAFDDDEDDDDDDDDDDEDEEDEEEDDMMMDMDGDVKMEEGGMDAGNQDGTGKNKTGESMTSSGQEIRLADIIDRAPSNTPNHELPCYRWKYYIHYREYNRRMDEWITDPARIVSPPSIGNAKVRAMKKAQAAKAEEERRNREREKREREALAWAEVHEKRRKMGGGGGGEGGDDAGGGGPDEIGSGVGSVLGNLSPFPRPVSQRASSRRASAAIAASSSNHQSSSSTGALASLDFDGGGGGSTTSASLLEEQERLRLTRSQRRKSSRGSGGGAGGAGGNTGDDVDEAGNKKNTTSSTTVTTLLPPDDEIIQDKVVTVAAQELDEHEGLDEAALREHEEVTKVKNVKEVELGRYRMDTWYYSPLPKELLRGGNMIDVLYVCEFTLQFFTRKEELKRFQRKYLPNNPRRHPPGNEIYRNGNLSMFEIDGFEERIYCQNLCYIAKLFLDHKTLYFDVDPFLFYVLCEIDNRGFHPVGYYSKEKYSDVGYNLACILTFPCHQRKGYGRFLIDFSYELSKKEEKVGSPEKPMSDLGQQAYKPYWTSTIVDFLLKKSDEKSMSIMDISKRTSIMAEDIIFTLNMLGLLKYINGVYFITAEPTLLKELAKKHPVKQPSVDPSKLHWTPYLTDVKRDKFSIHSKKPSIDGEVKSEKGGF